MALGERYCFGTFGAVVIIRFTCEVELRSSIGVLAVGSVGRARLMVAGGVQENRLPFVSCEPPDGMAAADVERNKWLVIPTLLTVKG
jgi:hypothetical protein